MVVTLLAKLGPVLQSRGLHLKALRTRVGKAAADCDGVPVVSSRARIKRIRYLGTPERDPVPHDQHVKQGEKN